MDSALTAIIQDSVYYDPTIEINSLLFEEIRYKISSYLEKMVRNIDIIKKHYPDIHILYESTSPQKIYFTKKEINDLLSPRTFSDKDINLIRENLEYYITEMIDGGLIIRKNKDELMPGDIHTYIRNLVNMPPKMVDLDEDIKKVLFEISPQSTIDKEAIDLINRLLNELLHRILTIATKLGNKKIGIDEMNTAIDIVFETDTLREHAVRSKVLHFSTAKILEIVSVPICENSVRCLTRVLEYITAEILYLSIGDPDPIGEDNIIQAIQNDSEFGRLFKYI